ncbi:hypothetical protein [Desulfosporosinus sp. SB140]|uniref:hypothetical protein n=1 Tax=Desulfosporosinus paludis TaxID=3115649 RepID=UPI003890ADA5
MALFKSKDEKENEKLEKLNEKMAKYGLENLSLEDKEKVKLILMGLMGTGLMDFGIALSGKSEDIAKLNYLGALVEQNWIIIKLLNDIKNK